MHQNVDCVTAQLSAFIGKHHYHGKQLLSEATHTTI